MAGQQQSEKSIFLAAVEIDTDAERVAFVEQACAGNPQLHAEVNALLLAHAKPQPLLDVAPAPGPTIDQPVAGLPGATIGPYKLLEQIGEGGMGTVWMAQQTAPVKRVVAVKLIKAGMDSKQVIARFEAERQALALMDHPNIAKVFDGGTTIGEPGGVSAGRPYFVMDLVKGVSITKYCDEHQLTPRQRLELFIPVCLAIQHAHQKGIIHRDLKPSNVLVAQYDGRPVPKVIDFGVAKAAGQILTDKTLVTGFGAIVGTLEYMSPEQAEFNQLDIDTRSDIYSLGVLLYELLAGSPPFSRKELEKAGMLEMLRVIREQEPSKPSTKLSTADGLPTLAANRGMEPAKLTKLVRGELDWIVMKALEKDRSRRYETANGFAMDLQRYLADEPVQACPPSARYRLRKFARRNKVLLAATAAGGLVVLLGVAGLIANSWLVAREKKNTETALESALTEKKRADQNLAKARQAVRDYLATTANDPRLRGADLLALRKSLLATAIPFFEEFAAMKSSGPEAEGERGQAIFQLAYVRQEMGEIEKARDEYARARDIFGPLASAHPEVHKYRESLAISLYNLGNVQDELHRPADAEAAQREALRVIDGLRAEEDKPEYRRHMAKVYINLGVLFSGLKKHHEAGDAYRKAVAVLEKLVEEVPGNSKDLQTLATSRGNLANVLNELGEDGALDLYRQVIAAKIKLVELDRTNREYRNSLAMSQNNLGTLLESGGDPAGAEAAYKEARATWAQLALDFRGIPDYRHSLAQSYFNQGNLLKRQKQLVEAIAAYRQAVGILGGLTHDFPRSPLYQRHLGLNANNLGMLLLENEQFGPAEEAFRTAIAAQEWLSAEYPESQEYGVDLGGNYVNLGIAIRDAGRPEATLEWFNKAIATLGPQANRKPAPPSASWFLRNAYWNRAEALIALKHYKESIPDWDRAHDLSAERDRWTYRVGRMDALARSGDHAKATAEADSAARADGASAGVLYDAACIYSMSSKAAAKEKDRAERYAARAIELLRQSVARGYKDLAHIKKDPDLDPLRNMEDFEKLKRELEEEQKGTGSKTKEPEAKKPKK